MSRGERSSLSIVIPESVEGIKGGEVSNATFPVDCNRDYPDCTAPPPPPFSSINKESSFCNLNNKVDAEMSITTPKSSNCTQGTWAKTRRSLRLSKTSIIKIPRAAKHKRLDPKKFAQRIVDSQMELKKSGGDSPLCVKKKMGRRGSQHHIKDNHKKIPTSIFKSTSTVKGASQLIANKSTRAKVPVKILSKKLDRTIHIPTAGPASSFPNSDAKQYLSSLTECPHIDNTFQSATNASAQNKIEIFQISADTNGPIPSVLFEESDDFWNTYLLDTYQQLASSNPEVQDFEPIPYDLMARGVPVYTEYHDSDQDSDAIIRANKSTTKGAYEGPMASLKDESDMNSKADDNQGQTKSNKAVVGPGSWQMNVIKGMLTYLDEVNDSPYSKYSIQFNMTTKLCTKKHLEGNDKYCHLPGSIFEEIVQTVGGPTFLEIYKNAKMYSRDRLSRAPVAGYQPSENKTNGCPSLVQVAVGYGFCMAKSLANNKHKSASWDHNSITYAVDQGSQKVLQMSNSQRLKFWKEHILNNDED
jgi:hypothetical protein